MALDYHSAFNDGKSWVSSIGSHVTRYRTALYVVFAAAIFLGAVSNWNWLTGAEVFRLLAALPCTFMMLMCFKARRLLAFLRNQSTSGDLSRGKQLEVKP